MRPTEVALGKATFTMPVTRWLEDGFGLYWGGVYALFADAPLAAAIWTTLPAAKAVATSELQMSFVRPMSRKTSNLVGRAETIHSGSQVGLSMIQITDHEGRLLAFGNTRCLLRTYRSTWMPSTRHRISDRLTRPIPTSGRRPKMAISAWTK
jgi:uncharacterized protein (TIGR00369 family)